MSVSSSKHLKYRIRKKFPKARNMYKPYLRAIWNWEEIFQEIDELRTYEGKFIKNISIKYNINYDTLKHKYSTYCKNKDLNYDKEYRGGHNKKFTEREEKIIFDYIRDNYIDKNKPLTNNIIKNIALDKLQNKDNTSRLKISNGWCTDFKKKWNLSTQKIRSSRIASKVVSDKEINIFLDKYDEYSKHIRDKYIFNYDETGYKVANPPKTAIRIKNSDYTKIDCKNNLKEKHTFGLTISKGGSFLKPILIAKGTTQRCLKKYKLNDSIIGTYNRKGWANEKCIMIVLNQISSITNNDESLLLMDQYRSHITQKVLDYAKSKNINILFIPVGLTSIYQPLDVAINGILKANAITSYSKFLASNTDKKYSYERCISDFISAKKEINKGTIIRSFNCLDRSKSNNGYINL